MYKFFTIFGSVAIALYFFSDPLLQMLGNKCAGETLLWYCNLPQYFSWAFGIISGITLLVGVFQSIKPNK